MLLLVYFSKVKIYWAGEGNENITFWEIDNVEIWKCGNYNHFSSTETSLFVQNS